MNSLSSIRNEAIASSYDFSNYKLIIDVGGGQGGLLLTILQLYKNVNGLLYDIEAPIKKAKEVFAGKKLLNRCQLVSGDFFTFVPLKGDLYIIKHVLHGLNSEKSVQLLQKISAASLPDSKILIIEMMMPSRNKKYYSKLNDLEIMLIFEKGCERSENDFLKIIADANLELIRKITLNMGLYILELKKG